MLVRTPRLLHGQGGTGVRSATAYKAKSLGQILNEWKPDFPRTLLTVKLFQFPLCFLIIFIFWSSGLNIGARPGMPIGQAFLEAG